MFSTRSSDHVKSPSSINFMEMCQLISAGTVGNAAIVQGGKGIGNARQAAINKTIISDNRRGAELNSHHFFQYYY